MITFQTTLIRLALVFILLSSTRAWSDANRIQVVTDIAPIHSLVTMVFGDEANIELLVPPSQSPHGFSLKPSQRRALEDAQLVVMLSKDFTPSLSRHLHADKPSRKVIHLSQIKADHAHDEHDATDTHEAEGANKHYDVLNDPHSWLNPENAMDWVQQIADVAQAIDSSNAERYQQNALLTRKSLSAMHESIHAKLKSVRSKNYIVYHDAYQHFAKSYGLQVPTAIALSDARSPSAAKLRSVRELAARSACAFSETLHDPSIVDTVTQSLPIKRGILDPIGSNQVLGKSLYANLMLTMADSFYDCLSD